MSGRTTRRAGGRHRQARASPAGHARSRTTPPWEHDASRRGAFDETPEETADEAIAADESVRFMEPVAHDPRRAAWDGNDDDSEVRAEVDRFVRDHFAPDEVEMAW